MAAVAPHHNDGGKRNPEWLGVEREPGGFESADPAPATAAEAVAALDRAHALWRDVLQQVHLRRGYLPDRQEIAYEFKSVAPGTTVRVDDDLN
jgi:hypothetical protein